MENFEENYDYDEQEENESAGSEEWEEVVSRPAEYTFVASIAENGTVPPDLLTFFHSYAYDCRKYFNICVADKDIVVFASGNLINFLDVPQKKIWFKVGSAGGGIGHISKNDIFGHLAVGENGDNPLITIYSWPSMDIVTTLEGGSLKTYRHLAYSPDGMLLASQGGEPDYFITVWNWQESKIMLRCKSHVHDVYNVAFSNYIPGHLTSSGAGHIKFWKICNTFTGLKLKGETGRFGKTEISDIIAIYPMPNEMVISGCEWGNILLWDEGLIKFEVCRKNKRTAHTKYITMFEYLNGELISVGMDGWIRFWFYETIDQAEESEDNPFLEIQPIDEFHITEEDKENPKESAMLVCMQKQDVQNPEEMTWYAQDGNGGLWQLNLNSNEKPEIHHKIFTCHAGPIVDMDVADWGPFVATFDSSGHLHVYNYFEKKLIIVHKFYNAGSQVVWLPCKIEKSGSILICAFGTGIIRMITVGVQQANVKNNVKNDYVRLIQVLKPHNLPITVMSLNIKNRLLITGSEDSTLFAFSIQPSKKYVKIEPIGYIEVASPINCVTWNVWGNDTTLLVGCLKGECVEVELPKTPQSYTTDSYKLVQCRPATLKFQSVRSAIERDIVVKRLEKEKEQRLAKRRLELEQLLLENPHMTIDEEAFFTDFHEDPPLPDLHIPVVPNKVLLAQYSSNDKIWLSMSGFDAGYLYEYLNPLSRQKYDDKPIQCRKIEDISDTELHTCLFYKNRKYVFLGTHRGEIRICKINPDDPVDLSDYWILPIHDSSNGCLTKMLLSHDHQMLLTCGVDGNLFAFTINDDTPPEDIRVPKASIPMPLPMNVEDIEEPSYPSLEDVITTAERNRILLAATKKKDETLQIIYDLAEEYIKIANRNQNLLPSQRITDLEIDPRITADLEKQLKAQMDVTQRKLAFRVEKSKLELQRLMDHFVVPITFLPFAVCSLKKEDLVVHSLREWQLETSPVFKEAAEKTLIHQKRQIGRTGEETVEEKSEEIKEREIMFPAEFLIDHEESPSGSAMQINQLLKKYKEIKYKMVQREREWKELKAKKPQVTGNYADEMASLLEKTRQTIGEYHLKMSLSSDLPKDSQNYTAFLKYKQLLACKTSLHQLREDFNARLKSVRTKKHILEEDVHKWIETLKQIHSEIPTKTVKPLPEFPTIDYDLEFPEHNLKQEKYTPMSEKVKQLRRERQSLFLQQSSSAARDLEYEVLLDETAEIEDEGSLSSLISLSINKIQDHSSMQMDILKVLSANDAIQTPWEREMKRLRTIRRIYKQDCILRRIEIKYDQLDKELIELSEQRLDIIYQSIYVNLFLLTLFEEYLVLRDSESQENALEESVDNKLKERSAIQLRMKTTTALILMKNQEIRVLQANIRDLGVRFFNAISQNQYLEFLQKIYKKKFTGPKKQDGSESMTQSSDTSLDDMESGDDSQIALVIFDENICPPGCDKELYDMAFSKREKRYVFENQVKEEQSKIEQMQKEHDQDLKILKLLEKTLKKSEEELKIFRLAKQKKLNDIDVTVILKFHQLQHIDPLEPENTPEIRDCVVFDKNTLTKLYERVGVLQEQTLALAEKRKNNAVHLKRIKIDCKYIIEENKKLAKRIKEEMVNKFGRKISLVDLYETVLHKMIFDSKSNFNKTAKDFDKRLKKIKEICTEKLAILEELIKNNTEKLSFLTVLEKERAKLKKMLDREPVSEMEMQKVELRHKNDLAKLKNILRSQIQQKQLLHSDIKNLQTSPNKLPPIYFNRTTLQP